MLQVMAEAQVRRAWPRTQDVGIVRHFHSHGLPAKAREVDGEHFARGVKVCHRPVHDEGHGVKVGVARAQVLPTACSHASQLRLSVQWRCATYGIVA